MSRPDPHSYFSTEQARTRHARFALHVDFERRVLRGTISLEFARPATGVLDLDTKGLRIERVGAANGAELRYELADEDPVLGQRLRIELPDGTPSISIDYETAPEALALQWLDPEQTAAGLAPFVYSQCQPIHARSLAPLQDSPAVRLTYEATLDVPETLTVVMSAGAVAGAANAAAGRRSFGFRMPQAIPPYLLAFAVGRIESRELSARSRVWAEPGVVDRAALEFAGIEALVEAAERLFGPYEWERYDLLVLPPAFPYGGMENPRLTFLTPTLLAGDGSLVDVVAHELAHSWTGNLVTNASMDHFWLNEGATVWAERRIVEAVYGTEAAALGWAIGEQALEHELQRFGATSPFTLLRQDLAGLNPDDSFSSIPYEKGSRFLALLERHVGRVQFDAFLRSYIARFRFASLTTEEFLEFLEARLPGAAAAVQAHAWVFEPGLPANSPSFPSAMLERLAGLARAFVEGDRPSLAEVGSWRPAELLVFLQHLPRVLPREGCAWLDGQLGLSTAGNQELRVEWLTIAASSDYEPAFPAVFEMLTSVGRLKYLRPLYGTLGRYPHTRALAREAFARGQRGYHGVARRAVEALMAQYPTDAPSGASL